MNKKKQTSSIPPLKYEGEWLHEAKDKAELFARTFSEKAKLPDDTTDCPFIGVPTCEFEEFIAIRSRYTKKLLKSLNVSKATGPDRIPASILKQIADEIAVPFTIVCRRLLMEGCWPEIWKKHIICPLYKKKSVYDARNYRGVHLTPILSKIAEKVIGKRLVAFLQSGKFGSIQWIFTGFGHEVDSENLNRS